MIANRSPAASIIVTSYNHERHVRAAIDSALSQTVGCEVVVVDDGSTDGSSSVVESYGADLKAVFQSNQGQAAAMSSGYALSTGDVVLFLDCDDLLHPDAVAVMLDEYRPGVSSWMWYLDIIDAEGRPTGSRIPGRRPVDGDLRSLVERRGVAVRVCPPTSGMAWSRSYLDRIMPLTSAHRAWPDTLLADTAPLFGEIVLIDRVLGCFRVHDASTSQQASVLSEENLERVRSLNEERAARLATFLGSDPGWLDRNWRHQVVLALLGKLRRSPQPTVREMAASALAADGAMSKRVALAAFATAVRVLPRRPSLAVADRLLTLQYM